jgi:hypothetical protein
MWQNLCKAEWKRNFSVKKTQLSEHARPSEATSALGASFEFLAKVYLE